MALNFPNSPNPNDTHEEAGQKWKWNGYAWDVVEEAIVLFKTVTGDTGSVEAANSEDSLAIIGGTDIATSVVGKTLTINFTGEAGGGGIANAFATVISDDGQYDVGSDQILTVVGGTNISTEVVTDSNQLTINLDSFPLSFLSNVSDSAPASGQVLKWDGSQWAPGTDVAEGGAGLDAETLGGFSGTYYLDYDNFTNTPSVLTLASISIGNELTPAGNGAITYDNSTGIFRYTPPTADGIGALTSVGFADLTSTPTTIAGYGITDAFDGQFNSLTSTPTTIAGYGITDSPSALTDLGISDGTADQVLTTDGAGNFTFQDATGGGGGEANQNAFSNVAVSGQSTVAADSTTDTLTLVAGTGISITTAAGTDSVTITSTAGGAENFSDLGDAPTGLAPYKFAYQCFGFYEVSSSGSLAYLFSQWSGNNPTIYAISATTIAFDLAAVPSHPFEIQDPQGNPYNTGLIHVASNGTVSTGSNAQGKTSGVLYWQIPSNISGGYRYQCTSHGVMVGNIQIKSIVSV